MRLLIQANYIGPLDDPCEITHVIAEIDPRHELDMRARLGDVLEMPNIYSVTFFDDAPQPVSCDFDDEVPDWFEEDDEVVSLPTGAMPPAADFRVVAATIRYMPGGLMLHFYERHGSDPYETATVPWDFIRANQRQGVARATILH